MTSFEIKAVVEDRNGPTGSHIIYLFNKDLWLLLPLKSNETAVRQVLSAREPSFEPRPSIHDTTRRLITSLKGNVEKVIISGYSNDIFYAYIRVKQGRKAFDVDAKPTDAIAIALRTGAPIFVDNKVVESVGIKVTPEMLKDAQ